MIDYPVGIVRVSGGDHWVADGSHSDALSRITRRGVTTNYNVGYMPQELTADGKGNLWFTTADYKNLVVRFTIAGSRLRLFGLQDTPGGGITLCGDANVWLVETKHIARITPSGVLKEFRTPSTAGGTGIACTSDGLVWFFAHDGRRYRDVLTNLDPKTGSVTFTAEVNESGSLALAAATDGSIWYVVALVKQPSYLDRFDPVAGRGTQWKIPRGIGISGYPAALAFAPGGALWYAGGMVRRRHNRRFISGGFVRFDTVTQKFTQFPAPESYNEIYELSASEDAVIWGTADPDVAVLRLF